MIIEIEKLSKKYLIAHQGRTVQNASLKEDITRHLKKAWRALSRSEVVDDGAPTIEEFWALSDINLKIEEGDKVALLGHNGAGKSTLLKIISRITEPTTGRLKIRGRVSSVLEVGTGFHPDLTGRENIFLNGAVMGMSYSEMKRKFDEIVAFSEIEQFLDTPVKRYSSGMYTRLGFAVAAHLDSDLLIVDEVLAVGDTQFQEKCLNKMNEIGTKGKTVLFVSHNVSSVLALCTKGIYLEKGKLVAFEPIDQAVNRYLMSCPIAGFEWKGIAGDEHICVTRASVGLPSSKDSFFRTHEKTQLDIDFQILKAHPDLILGFSILNSRHEPIAVSRVGDHVTHQHILKKVGTHRISFDFDLQLFHPGEYHIRLDSSLRNKKKILHDDVLLKFAICSSGTPTEKEGISLGNRWCVG